MQRSIVLHSCSHRVRSYIAVDTSFVIIVLHIAIRSYELLVIYMQCMDSKINYYYGVALFMIVCIIDPQACTSSILCVHVFLFWCML